MATQTLGINITSNVSGALPGINRATNALEGLNTEAHNAASGLDDARSGLGRFGSGLGGINSSIGNLSSGIAALGATLGVGFSTKALIEFGAQITSVAGKYEKFTSILENTIGQEAAARTFAQITQYASKTPYQVDEITSSFIKLVNRGFKPTTQQLTQIGDLAASQGKSFDQLTEAILDAQTGEFERLKEFGIIAKQSNDGVTLSFKDQTVTVEKNTTAVRNAILSFGDLNGVAGATAKVSETLEGKISNLGDSWEQFQAQLGKNLLPATKATINELTSGLDELTRTLRTFGEGARDTRIQDSINKTFNETLNGLNAASVKGTETEKKYRLELAKLQDDFYNKEIDAQNRAVNARGKIQKEQAQDQARAFSGSIKAIQDAITEFEKQRDAANKGLSFGASSKTTKTLSDALKDLNADLLALDVQFAATGGSLDKLSEDKIKTISNALKELSTFGVVPGTALFADLQQQIKTLQSTLQSTPVTLNIPIAINPLPAAQNTAAIQGIAAALNDDFSRAFKTANDKAISQILEAGTENGIEAISSGIGKALSGGGLSSVFDAFINSIASLGESLGKQLITTGVAIEAFKTSLSSLQGFGAIAAGAALIAASAAFRSLAKGGVASFATGGGVIGGPQLALIGDNPGREEYVIPSEVLDKMGTGYGEVGMRLTVNEFLIWLDRGRRNLNG